MDHTMAEGDGEIVDTVVVSPPYVSRYSFGIAVMSGLSRFLTELTRL